MRSFSKASIQQKLLLVVFCTNLLGLAIACLAFEIYERSGFRTSLVGELTAQADALALNTAARNKQRQGQTKKAARGI